MEEKKKLKIMVEESSVTLVDKANTLKLSKEDIVALFERNGSFYMFYFN